MDNLCIVIKNNGEKCNNKAKYDNRCGVHRIKEKCMSLNKNGDFCNRIGKYNFKCKHHIQEENDDINKCTIENCVNKEMTNFKICLYHYKKGKMFEIQQMKKLSLLN